MNGLTEAKNSILAAKTIAISGHVNPDGDSIGSLLSLGLGLESLGKRVYMISREIPWVSNVPVVQVSAASSEQSKQ